MQSEPSPSSDVARLVARAQDGDSSCSEELSRILYTELHAIAAAFLRSERPGHTLQPTALVNEAYLRLLGPSSTPFANRAHFFGSASRCMRQVLIKHARTRDAAKRGGDMRRVTLTGIDTPADSREVDILALEEALVKLSSLDERQCRVVEMRFFGGLSVEQCALVLGVSARTVELDWQMARAWLMLELTA